MSCEVAVRLVFESKRPIAHVAQDLGVHEEALSQWVRQAEADVWVPRTPFGLSPEARSRLCSDNPVHAASKSCQRISLGYTRAREYQIGSSLATWMDSPRGV